MEMCVMKTNKTKDLFLITNSKFMSPSKSSKLETILFNKSIKSSFDHTRKWINFT